MSKAARYTARYSGLKVTSQDRDFLRRRTQPFLDSVGLDRPISMLLEEVYLQGLRDAADALRAEPKGATR